MRRAFWIALGLGAGATVGILASRWAKRQTQKVAPANLGRQAKSGLSDLGSLFRESMDAYSHAVMAAWTRPPERGFAFMAIALSIVVVFAASIPGLRARFAKRR